MGLANTLLLLITGALLAIALRNLLGGASRFGVKSGWIAMMGFATLAAFCFWKAREWRANAATVAVMVAAQKFMVLYLIGLLLSAYGVGVQRRKLRLQRATAPVPSTSGPPEP